MRQESSVPTHYEILGVPRTATADEMRRAYRALAKALHPDARGGTDTQARFAEVARVYEVLSDRAARRAYDRSLDAAAAKLAGKGNSGAGTRSGHFTWGNIAEPEKGDRNTASNGKRDALSEFDELYETFFGSDREA